CSNIRACQPRGPKSPLRSDHWEQSRRYYYKSIPRHGPMLVSSFLYDISFALMMHRGRPNIGVDTGTCYGGTTISPTPLDDAHLGDFLGLTPQGAPMRREPRPRGSLHYSKPPMTVEALVERLASRGLEITSRDKASRYLRHIG